jgi:hypothetical protein
MVARVVEPPAGIPLRMTPRRGHRRAAQGVGAAVRLQVHPWHPTAGLTSLVADRARSRAANREPLAPTPMPWSTRVPATVRDAPAAWAQADPPAMVALQAGDRAHALTSPDGGVEPRGVRISAAPRQAQAPRTIDQPWRKPRAQAVNAGKPCCGGTWACAAEARQALATGAQDVPATCLGASTGRATPRDGPRGRPGPGVPPAQMVSQSAGAVAASRAARQALSAQHRCVILATNARDATPRPPPPLLDGDTGQTPGERGCRGVKDPAWSAAARDRTTPARSMALVLGMTGCWLGSAALASRLRQALRGA